MKKRILIILFIVFIFILLISKSSLFENEENKKINELLSSLSTREKITQMIMPSLRFWGKETNATGVTKLNDELTDLLNKNSFAGIILFSNNIVNEKQTVELIDSIKTSNKKANSKIDLFIGVDQEGGNVSRIKYNTQTIGNMGIGATNNSSYAKQTANLISNELKALGFNLNFAPVLDINNNPNNSVIGTRSFSDNPYVVSEFGKEYIKGLHDNKIISVVKHFMGHGDTSVDSHTSLPLINKSYDELYKNELIPFMNVIDDTDMIMMAHIQYPLVDDTKYLSEKTGETLTLPASLSKKIVNDTLRKKIKYNGVIISDAMDMDAIRKHFTSLESTKLAIDAGVDIILMPFDISTTEEIKHLNDYIDTITNMVDNNIISIKRIDESVKRILKLKNRYGLLSENDDITKSINIDYEKNKEKSFDISLKSITLLKNNNKILPISKDKKVIILYADNSQKSMIETAINDLNINTNILLKKYTDFDVNSFDSKDIDIIIGISNYSNISKANKNLFDKLINSDIDFVLLSSDLPYDVSMFHDSDAIVVCYNLNGIPAGIYTIYGKNNPDGKLPLNIPKLSSNLKFTNDLLYTREYGLEY